MEKINFSNGEKISAAKVTIDNVDYEVTPATYDGATPLNATVFNNMQENIEDAIDTKANTSDVYTKQETNALIPTKAHQINVGEDEEYKVNLLKTKNLCDKQNISTTYWESSNNKILYDSTNKSYSIYIPIKPNTTYTISKATAGHTFRVATTENIPYSSAGTPVISTTANHTGTSITIPTESTAKYLWVVFFNTNNGDTGSYTEVLNTLQIEEGSTATTYEPFIPNQINVDNEKYSDTINVGATEDSRSRVNVLKSKNLINVNINDVQSGLWFSTDETSITQNTNGFYVVMPITAGSYTISRKNNNSITGLYFAAFTTASNPANGVSIVDKGSQNGATIKQINITATSTAKYLIIYIIASVPSQVDNAKKTSAIEELQVEKGNEQTAYEPYVAPSIKVDNEEIYAKPEIGTNENGSYIKYANGLMICSGVKSFTGANFTTQNGTVYIPASSPSINFAQQFIENPVVTLTAFNRANGVYESGLSTSLVAIWPFAFSSISNVNYSIHYIAIGRWK